MRTRAHAPNRQLNSNKTLTLKTHTHKHVNTQSVVCLLVTRLRGAGQDPTVLVFDLTQEDRRTAHVPVSGVPDPDYLSYLLKGERPALL